MDAPTQSPTINGEARPIQITLIIALIITLAAFIFFGLSTTTKERKDTFQFLGGICLVSGAILLFVAALQYIFIGNKASVEYLSPAEKPSTSDREAAEKIFIIISADSWCGFSKKMSAEVPTLKSLLEPMGIKVVLVSDVQDKAKFQKLAAEHSARGFPHSVLIVDGTKITDIRGYMPALKIQEIISSKLERPNSDNLEY